MEKFRWFQIVAILTFSIFMGLLVFVTLSAFGRRSGNTGIDMAQIQQMRAKAESSGR